MDFTVNALELYGKDWALVTAGEKGHYNTMTIGWGGLGTLWGKPAVTVYVKPIRYTHEFLDQYDYFTVSFYAEEYRKALQILGTLSGRDTDKVSLSKLTPQFLEESVTFEEAKVTLLCKKIYRQDMDVEQMPADVADTYYMEDAPHTMYVGEVVKILR